jgi:hypothetical protein
VLQIVKVLSGWRKHGAPPRYPCCPIDHFTRRMGAPLPESALAASTCRPLRSVESSKPTPGESRPSCFPGTYSRTALAGVSLCMQCGSDDGRDFQRTWGQRYALCRPTGRSGLRRERRGVARRPRLPPASLENGTLAASWSALPLKLLLCQEGLMLRGLGVLLGWVAGAGARCGGRGGV